MTYYVTQNASTDIYRMNYFFENAIAFYKYFYYSFLKPFRL